MKFQVKRRPEDVVAPEHLLRQLRAYEELLSKSTGSLPYRQQIQLNAITEGLALIRGDVELKQDHVDTIARLSKWINYDFKEI
ncbi:MAG: hypothetical protein ABSG57_01890 [Candidatus Bathyarchaeia archaeon]